MTVTIDAELVRRMVGECFPRWAGLPVRAVLPGGHDNRTFRLGDDLAVRLPSAERYVAAVAKEQRWLPVLARQLPLPVPEPVAAGRPAAGFPWPWSVNRWIAGRPLQDAVDVDADALARDLAGFLVALRAADTRDAPPAGAHNFHRGGDLAVYAGETAAAIARLPDRGLATWAQRVFAQALVTRWSGQPVWVHGDVAAGNLLVGGRGGKARLAAVIDFGGCAVGDPASDCVMAWTWFGAGAATVFRDALGLDDHTWGRAAGWALWKALIGLGSSGDGPSRRTIARLRQDLPG